MKTPKNKGGRKTTEETEQLQQEAYKLIKQGLTQKNTANRIGVSPKTLGGWVRRYNWKPSINQDAETLASLKNRLNEMAKDKNTPTADLKNMVAVIQQLENA
ncbi:MAG: transposase [Flavobacteriaceae bacterium]